MNEFSILHLQFPSLPLLPPRIKSLRSSLHLQLYEGQIRNCCFLWIQQADVLFFFPWKRLSLVQPDKVIYFRSIFANRSCWKAWLLRLFGSQNESAFWKVFKDLSLALDINFQKLLDFKQWAWLASRITWKVVQRLEHLLKKPLISLSAQFISGFNCKTDGIFKWGKVLLKYNHKLL